MIIDGDVSILDKINLNKGRFEAYVACGLRKSEILSSFFNISSADMDKWCKENYNGLDFNTCYEIIRQNTRAEYYDALKDLGLKGNPTAMAIVERFTDREGGDNGSGMIFNVNVRVENNDDKVRTKKAFIQGEKKGSKRKNGNESVLLQENRVPY